MSPTDRNKHGLRIEFYFVLFFFFSCKTGLETGSLGLILPGLTVVTVLDLSCFVLNTRLLYSGSTGAQVEAGLAATAYTICARIKGRGGGAKMTLLLIF